MHTMAEVGKVRIELGGVQSKLDQEKAIQRDLRDRLSEADNKLSGTSHYITLHYITSKPYIWISETGLVELVNCWVRLIAGNPVSLVKHWLLFMAALWCYAGSMCYFIFYDFI